VEWAFRCKLAGGPAGEPRGPALLYIPRTTIDSMVLSPTTSSPALPAREISAEQQARIRTVLLGVVLFFGLAVWVYHSIVAGTPRDPGFLARLRGVGVMTWIYALVLLLDQRFYQSRFARRRRDQLRIPENLIGWILGQMLPWFGIVYFLLTGDLRWYLAGLLLMGWTFRAFPIETREEPGR
jgi:hypothetical protein